MNTSAEVHDEIMRILGPVLPVHFKDPVGVLYALIRMGGADANEAKIISIPVRRWTGYVTVQNIENRPDFIRWVADPFTGEVNGDIEITWPMPLNAE